MQSYALQPIVAHGVDVPLIIFRSALHAMFMHIPQAHKRVRGGNLFADSVQYPLPTKTSDLFIRLLSWLFQLIFINLLSVQILSWLKGVRRVSS